jgi:hypothetical protein
MTLDRAKVSFAEAEGKARFPAVLKWGEIDQRLRASLWTPFYRFIKSSVDFDSIRGSYRLRGPAAAILQREHLHRRHLFINDFRHSRASEHEFIGDFDRFFRKADYVELFNVVTFFVRDRDCPVNLKKELADALDRPFSPYRLDLNTKTIIPILSEEQASTLGSDVNQVFESQFAGAKTHLQASLDALNQGDHRSVVREAINAVESAVRDFTKDPGLFNAFYKPLYERLMLGSIVALESASAILVTPLARAMLSV